MGLRIMLDLSFEIISEDKIELEILHGFEPEFCEHDRNKFSDELYSKICDHAIFLVAKSDEKIVGYCAFYANDIVNRVAYVSLIAVKKDKQGLGLGDAMLDEVIRISRLQKMKFLG